MHLNKGQSRGQRPNISHIPSKLLTDSTFLNSLHSRVNPWIKAIQAVTKLTRDASSRTGQLLVGPREGIEGHGGAVEERGGGMDLYKDLLPAVEDLSTCWYISEAFSELLGKIQVAVRTAFPSLLSPQG